MAAGGSLAPAGLLWLCLAPAALLRLPQPQPQAIQFVKPGEPVEIGCGAIESESRVAWYRRSTEGPALLLGCSGGTTGGFSCQRRGHKVILHIASARPEHTGLYLCAYFSLDRREFVSSTALLVGDSWMSGSWVRVLAPHGDPRGPLVCAVGATAGPVLVSWLGGPRRVLGLGGGSGPFVSPLGTAEGSRGVCEVRFNSSGAPVRRSVELRRAAGSCMTPGAWVLAVAGVLLLLSLCLSTCCLQRPTPTGHEAGTPMPATPEEDEGQLTYAQLIFTAPAGRPPVPAAGRGGNHSPSACPPVSPAPGTAGRTPPKSIQ